MERKICFRGKDDKNGKWVYGFLSMERDMRSSKPPFSVKTAIVYDDGGVLLTAFVNPDTVGQFTGFLDRCGKEIYEGDVVQIRLTLGVIAKAVVVYEDGMFKADCIDRDYFGKSSLAHHTELLVIDNIHDNPKLRKGGRS